MKHISRQVAFLALAGMPFAASCSGGDAGPTPMETTMPISLGTSSLSPALPGPFLPTASLHVERLGWEPFRTALLPVPVKRPSGLRWAVLQYGAVVSNPNLTAVDYERAWNEIENPCSILYYDAVTAQFIEQNPNFNEHLEAYFGVPRPPGATGCFYVVGHHDDPRAPPKDRWEQLRQRVFMAFDVLLPLFTDPNRPWTDDANKAAREVRDFFPLAAEPGLWPYYEAEGREFFAWVERNAPPGKAALPWEEAK